MSGHTPGPWLAMRGTESTGRQVADWAVSDNIDAWICTGPTWDDEYEEESFANARLIAAAPEMLEALIAISKWMPITTASEGGASAASENVRAADLVRAAIAKATQP